MAAAAASATAEFEGTVEALLPLTKYGQIEAVRTTAIRALGRIGKGDPRVVQALAPILEEETRYAPGAAGQALAQLGDPTAHAALKQRAQNVRNSGLRAGLDRAVRILRLGQTTDVPEPSTGAQKKKSAVNAKN
jgi:HEAT repeat protein